jgi:hypothetical protein
LASTMPWTMSRLWASIVIMFLWKRGVGVEGQQVHGCE